MKYTKSADTSATWRPDGDQRRPTAINGEGTEEGEESEGLEGSEGGRQDPAGDDSRIGPGVSTGKKDGAAVGRGRDGRRQTEQREFRQGDRLIEVGGD